MPRPPSPPRPADGPGPDGPFRVAIRVKPRGRQDRVGGTRGDGALTVEVQAPAVDGRANSAVTRVVADAFGVPARQVRLVTGERSRTKLVEIDGPPGVLAARLTELLEAQ